MRVIPPPKDLERIPWQSGELIGEGVAFKDTGNPRGTSAFLAYAGWSVSLAGARAWATALYRAALEARGVRYIWAIQGPAHPYYAGHEIGTKRIVDALAARVTSDTGFVLVAAHSSGSYVAHELFARLEDGSDPANAVGGKVVYFDLDGALGGLTPAVAARLRHAYFVASIDGTSGTPSPNADGMRAAPTVFPGASFFANPATGCKAGATWCVHMTLITTQPHDPTRSSPLDYADFAGRPVVHAWLDATADDAQL